MSAASATQPVESQSHEIRLNAVLQLALINILWGASSVASKTALMAFGPFTLTFVRFAPAGLILLLLARLRRRLPPIAREDLWLFLALGGIGIAATYGIFYFGLQRTTATDASLLFACEPILIALFGYLFLKERLSWLQWTGFLVGITGIWLIAGRALGDWLALAGLACECCVSVPAKRLAMRYPGLLVVAYEMLIGAALMLPLALWEWHHHPHEVSLRPLAALAFLSLVCSVFCYGIWYRLLSRHAISQMGVFILLQPLLGPLYGHFLRGEALRTNTLIGALLVFCGIALTIYRKRSSADSLRG
ncbi:DMT family transporter [Chthonomonas calidirosea]|uniref:DMT family transporter n=1 Tax=Chthonomonas calidirosea TaxID=454171 RepID=UPI0006EC9C5B|nr:DMT family transporter [Chthonomonas calidirosea]CEK14660.1 DMT(drug/metabolite transporter) superfamily permease [Chthonomonas calidirosea]